MHRRKNANRLLDLIDEYLLRLWRQIYFMDMEKHDMIILNADTPGCIGSELQKDEQVTVVFYQGVPFWIEEKIDSGIAERV